MLDRHHKKYYKGLHRYKEVSEIDRSEWNRERKKIWQELGQQLKNEIPIWRRIWL